MNRKKQNILRAWPLLLPSILFLGIFTAGFLVMVNVSLYEFRPPPTFWATHLTQANYLRILTDTFALFTVANTLLLSLEATLITLLFAYPIAQLLVRPGHGTRRKLLLSLMILLLFINSVVRAASWITILGASGLISNMLVQLHLLQRPTSFLFTNLAVVLGMVSYNMPYAILMLASSLRYVGFELEEAAKTLGANEFQTFRYVTLPFSELSLLATGNLIFVVSIAAFVSPTILGGGVIPFITVNIYQTAVDALNYPVSAAFSTFFTVLTLAIIFISGRIFDAIISKGVRTEL